MVQRAGFFLGGTLDFQYRSGMKPPLSDEERQTVEELLKLAGGMACKAPVSRLKEPQAEVIQRLARKGYVMLTKRNFWVILPP